MIKLELFYFDACPFCQIVLKEIDALNIKVDYLDITQDTSARQRLQTDTGRSTVPCLYHDNTPMFESQDIIQWLRDNQERLPKK